ncbi:MAG: arginyltransferase [Fimbriiglobus sp.]
MISLYSFYSSEKSCSYLPREQSRQRYIMVSELSEDEYSKLMVGGWRRFGYLLFQPVCDSCRACQSLRVVLGSFKPNTSQKRAIKANHDLRLVIQEPSVSVEKLALYDKYHSFQSGTKGWNHDKPETAEAYIDSFVDNPYPTQEWCYYVDDKLVGVGYVDDVPAGYSAIYFYYDPDERPRSLGTYNILRMIQEGLARQDEHLYLGYYVRDCISLAYKANFRPYEVYVNSHWQEV